MELETFAEPVRLGGTDRFVLWQSAFEFDVPERLVRDEAGRIPAFPTSEAAFAYAAARRLTLSGHPPGVDVTHDLDAVTAWAARPTVETLNYDAVVDAWRFLKDAAVLPGMYDDGLEPELEQVVWQLDSAELVRLDPKSAHLGPTWTAERLTVLAAWLRRGIEEFAALLTLPPPAV